MRSPSASLSLALLCALPLGAACGDDGTGAIEVTTYGEAFIEDQIPAAGAGAEGFVDGYTVRYSRFLVTLGDLAIADREGTVGSEMPGQRVFDLHRPGPHPVLAAPELAAKRWDRVSVAVTKASGAEAGNASAEDVALMNDNGYSVYVAGEATKDATTIRFAWGFSSETRYRECHEQSSGEGVVVPTGGTATIQLTIHGDHLFYDDLQSAEPSLRFAAVAGADADGDGEVTLEELARVDLTTLPIEQYGTGGDGGVTSLGDFLGALTRTLVHYQGEGHCKSVRL